MDTHGDRKRKAKNKKWYQMQAKKAKRPSLEKGQKGFLVFCNKREKEAKHEAYRILNEYADVLHGPEANAGKKPEDSESSDDDDIESALEKEKQELKDVRERTTAKKRRFEAVDSGAKNVLFIRALIPDPISLATTILKDLQESQKQKTRFLLRLIPIEIICKATDEEIAEKSSELAKKHFTDLSVSYCIIFKSRCNEKFSREDAIHIIGKAVQEASKDVKVEYKNPDFVFIVEVIRNYCCLSVIPNYFGFKKYNLAEVSKPPAATVSENEKHDDGQTLEEKETVEVHAEVDAE